KFSTAMFDIVRRNRVRMNASTLLYWRAMNALGSIAARVPEFDLVGQMREFFHDLRPDFTARVKASVSDFSWWAEVAETSLVAARGRGMAASFQRDGWIV